MVDFTTLRIPMGGGNMKWRKRGAWLMPLIFTVLIGSVGAEQWPGTAVTREAKVEWLKTELRTTIDGLHAEQRKPIREQSAVTYERLQAILKRLWHLTDELPQGGEPLLKFQIGEVQQAVSRMERDFHRRIRIWAQPWPEVIREAVLRGTVQIGMTREQVREAWGIPDRIHETITAAGHEEQWVYRGPQYLYFRHDRLVAIQQSR